jgi:hypothetical protein
MKKPKNSSSDDFDFMDGGLDEFFPLENPSGKDAPPKGVKGYLKNVVKSVVNLGVKVNKTLYPEAFELGSSFKDAFTEDGNPIDIKSYISKYKNMAKNAYAEGQVIAKEIAEDAKTALRTGKFVKGEDDDSSLDDMFGSMFGDDYSSNSLDFGSDFNDDFGDNDDDTSKKGRISAGEATIKSSVASTKAILKSNQKQRAAIMGAAQSHIRHETELFAQQMEIDQQRHKQKMTVMRNIATNLAKVINQNNIKLKAQMEYSAKSLAFAQDTAAMLKEIRNAQWELVKPKENIDDVEQTRHSKAFGRSGNMWNVSSWIKQVRNQIKDRSAGGIFDMLGMANDSINMMTDMGMKRSTVIKDMIGSMVFDSILKGTLSSRTARNIDLFNLKTQGLGSALNKQLGRIASGDSKILNNVLAWGDKKGGLLGSIIGKGGELLRNAAGSAHIYDEAVFQTNRYKMGDPDKVHPFDNKAHKVLTEVIPAYLSKISAGVNHTEEQLFDFSLNRFVSSKIVKSSFENAKNSAYEETRGIDSYKEAFTNTKSYNSTFDFEKVRDIMMRNWFRAGKTFDKQVVNQVKWNGNEPGPYSYIVLDGTNIDDPKDQKIACYKFAKALESMRPTEKSSDETRDAWTQFVTSGSTYNTRLGESMLQNETDISRNISSIQHSTVSSNDEIEHSRNEHMRQIKRINERLEKTNTSTNLGVKARLKLIEELQTHQKALVDLNSRAQESVSGINENLGSLDNKTISNFNDYRIHALEDSSTHGLIQNIYNLLLSGIDVYTTPKEKSSENRNEYIKNTKTTLASKLIQSSEQQKTVELSQQYNKFNGICPDPSNKKDLGEFLRQNDIYEWNPEADEPKFTGKVYWQENGKMVSALASKVQWTLNRQYYFKINEYNAWWSKYRREEEFKQYGAGGFDDAEYKGIYNIPLIGNVAKTINKLQNFKSELGGKILGNLFYGEDNKFGSEKKMLSDAKESVINAKDNIIEGAKAYKADIDEKGFKEATADRAKRALQIAKDREKIALDQLKKQGYDLKNYTTEQVDKLIIDNLGQETFDKIKNARDIAKKYGEKSVTAIGGVAGATIASVKGGVPTLVNTIKKQKATLGQKLLNGRLSAIKIGKLTLAEAVAKIDSPTLTAYFMKEKDPIVKAKYLLDNIHTYPQLDIFKEKLTEFVSTAESGGAMGVLGSMAMGRLSKIKDRLKNTGTKLLNKFFQKKDIKKLMSITVDNVKLQDLIKSDSNLTREVSEAFAKAEAAGSDNGNPSNYGEELLNVNNAKLEPYKPAIREWVENTKNRVGSFGNKVTNFTDKIIDKIMNKVDQLIFGKDREGNKLPLLTKNLADVEGIKGTKLGDVIDEIAAEHGASEMLRHTKSESVKVMLLLKTIPTDDERFEEFRIPLQQFLDNKKTELKNKGKEKAKAFTSWMKDKGVDIKNATKEQKDKLLAQFNAENPDEENEETTDKTKPNNKDTKLSKLVSKTSGIYRSFLSEDGTFKPKRGMLSAIGGLASGFVSGIGGIFGKNDKGPVEGDTASEQNAIKLEKKKQKEQKKKEKEEKSRWDTILAFFKHNKDGVHLDEKQVDDIKESNENGFWGRTKKLLTSPKFLTGAATVAGGIAGGIGGLKGGQAFGKWAGNRGRQYQNMLHGDQENWALENTEYNNAEQGKTVFGTTGAIAGTMYGAYGANKLWKLGGKFGNIARSKGFEKLAAGAEKLHLTKLSDKFLNKAVKAEERGIKYDNMLKKGKGSKVFGKITKAATGAMVGATAASALAEKIGLEGNAATIATVAGGVVGAASGNILIDLFNKIATGIKGAAGKILLKIASKIVKIIPKYGAKMAAGLTKLAASSAAIVAQIAYSAVRLADGMTEDSTKKNFNMGKGSGVTWGMRLASGLYGLLNSFPGIDIIIALLSEVLGYPNFAFAIYDWFGSDAEKNALARYQSFQTDRAKLYGVTRDQLTAYEQRFQSETNYGKAKNAVKGSIRSVGGFLASGLASGINFFGGKVDSDKIIRSSDKLASDLLGFADKEIYLYWKSEKYDPIEEGAVSIIERECGSVEAFSKMICPVMKDLDGNKDGNVTKDELETSELYQTLKKQAKARVEVLKYMQKYILDNKLAWLNNKLTLEKFNKYRTNMDSGKETAKMEARANKDEEKKAKRTEEEQAAIAKALESGEGNRALRKSMTAEERKMFDAKHKAVAIENTRAKLKHNSEVVKRTWSNISNWIKSKYKEYKFNKKEEAVMDSATSAIRSVITNVDPTYYGNNIAAEVSPKVESVDGNTSVVHVGGNGGPETFGTNEGYFVKVKEDASKIVNSAKNVANKAVKGAKQVYDKLSSNNSYDLSGQTPKNVVMNSIVSDFAKNFGNDLIKRLNILEEMHKENLRHNKVSEDFFKACLAMMSQIAKSSGNTYMGSKIDDMMSQIVR